MNRVLLVDDHATFREPLAFITCANWRVTYASRSVALSNFGASYEAHILRKPGPFWHSMLEQRRHGIAVMHVSRAASDQS